MRGFISIVLSCFVFFLLSNGCENPDPYQQHLPSLIYADDDSTLLGHFSTSNDKRPQIAPYFCASLEDDLKDLLSKKDKNGQYLYQKKNGDKYDIYSDELKIYTTINPTLQEYAEAAIRKHHSEDLQPAFTKNNAQTNRFPFSNTYNGRKVSNETIEHIMKRARKSSKRYNNMFAAGVLRSEIEASFDEPTNMRVFSWNGEIDTVMTPNDSIRYYKNFIRSGLLSIEPSTGHVKAWVGGIDHDHFQFDHVKQGKRQIGSTIKPFTYAAAFSMGVAEPCMILGEDDYCVDPCDPNGRKWCPSGSLGQTVIANFSQNTGGTNVAIMSLMGACSGPMVIAKLFKRMNIDIPNNQVVPSMCLGTPDMSLFEMTAANAMLVNNGIFIEPETIRRIEDKHGNIIYSSELVSREVLNSMTSFDVLQMMKMVVSSGTSTSLKWHKKWGGITHPTAGKTGTTQGNADMWFFGLTPDLVTGIWTGGEDKQVRFRSMTWGQGARASLPIYGYYMQQVYADLSLNISTEDFVAPASYPPNRFNCDTD